MKTSKSNIHLLGDIHANFNVIIHLCENERVKDSLIIQVGDFGFGFCGKYIEDKSMERLDQAVENSGCELWVLRGNHCDPSYYKGDKKASFEKTYKNIKLIKNQDTATLNGKKVLFLDGAISIDRAFRAEWVNWWSDEGVGVDFNSLSECDVIISHTCPTEFNVGDENFVKPFFDKDSSLENDLDKERSTYSRVLSKLKPKEWYFGHFHESTSDTYTDFEVDCFWRCVNINELVRLK